MKSKNISHLIVSLVILSGTPRTADCGWDFLKPVSGSHVKLQVGGKDRSYYVLDDNSSITVKVTGPTQIRVFTRAVSPDDGEVVYSFVVNRDNDKRYHLARVSSPDQETLNPAKSAEHICDSKTPTFDVPAGEHAYSIKLPKESNQRVYARVMTHGLTDMAVDYVAYLPRLFAAEVKILVREQEYLYYRGGDQKPIEIEVIGPTRLKGMSRLEFDHTMRGEKLYRLQVLEGGKVITTHPFKTQPSGTASFRDKSSLLLGEGDTFYIDVPKGKHRYTIRVPEPGYSVIFRFYLPQSDLGKVEIGDSLIDMVARLRG